MFLILHISWLASMIDSVKFNKQFNSIETYLEKQ